MAFLAWLNGILVISGCSMPWSMPNAGATSCRDWVWRDQVSAAWAAARQVRPDFALENIVSQAERRTPDRSYDQVRTLFSFHAPDSTEVTVRIIESCNDQIVEVGLLSEGAADFEAELDQQLEHIQITPRTALKTAEPAAQPFVAGGPVGTDPLIMLKLKQPVDDPSGIAPQWVVMFTRRNEADLEFQYAVVDAQSGALIEVTGTSPFE